MSQLVVPPTRQLTILFHCFTLMATLSAPPTPPAFKQILLKQFPAEIQVPSTDDRILQLEIKAKYVFFEKRKIISRRCLLLSCDLASEFKYQQIIWFTLHWSDWWCWNLKILRLKVLEQFCSFCLGFWHYLPFLGQLQNIFFWNFCWIETILKRWSLGRPWLTHWKLRRMLSDALTFFGILHVWFTNQAMGSNPSREERGSRWVWMFQNQNETTNRKRVLLFRVKIDSDKNLIS